MHPGSVRFRAHGGYQCRVVEAADECDRAQRFVPDDALEFCHWELDRSLQLLVLPLCQLGIVFKAAGDIILQVNIAEGTRS